MGESGVFYIQNNGIYIYNAQADGGVSVAIYPTRKIYINAGYVFVNRVK